jgi:hypothetical protein
MATYRVDPAEVADLGASLVEVAESLALMGDPEPDLWALGPGSSAGALAELLGGWRLARLRTAADLTGLGEAAVGAGGLYVDTDAGVRRRLGGAPA